MFATVYYGAVLETLSGASAVVDRCPTPPTAYLPRASLLHGDARAAAGADEDAVTELVQSCGCRHVFLDVGANVGWGRHPSSHSLLCLMMSTGPAPHTAVKRAHPRGRKRPFVRAHHQLSPRRRGRRQMKFGKDLEQYKHAGWEDEYIDYKLLKSILQQLEEPGTSKDDVDGEFFTALEDELEKVNRAFHDHASEIEAALDQTTSLARRRNGSEPSDLDRAQGTQPSAADSGSSSAAPDAAAVREAKNEAARQHEQPSTTRTARSAASDLRVDQPEGLPEDHEEVRQAQQPARDGWSSSRSSRSGWRRRRSAAARWRC